MAVQNMSERAIGRKPGYYHAESLADGVTGDPVVVPGLNGLPVTCTIIIVGTSGKVEFTTSSDVEVAAGTATWQDWAGGTVTANTSDALIGPVTAVRGVSVSGEVKFQVVV